MKIKTVLQFIALVAAGAGAYYAFQEYSIPNVEVEAVRVGNATETATGNVTVLPYGEARIVAPKQAILTKFNYKEGNLVPKGTIVAELDADRLPYQLKTLENNLEALEQKIAQGSIFQFSQKTAKEEFEKTQQLHAKGHVSDNALRDAEVRFNETEFRILIEQIDIQTTRRNLATQIDDIKDQINRLKLIAPFDGVIMAPAAFQGDILFSGNSITKVTSTEKMIKVEVNQDDLPYVRNSKRVLVRFFSFPENDYEGTVNYLVPIGNSGTQRFTVFLKMKELPNNLLSGQTGEASFIANEHKNTLLIPRSALLGDSVFVAKDGRLEQRKVKTGFLSITTAEITGGLREGERVVTKNVILQREGDRVNILEKKK